jgi:dTDP-glucose 4,6-dehydratase
VEAIIQKGKIGETYCLGGENEIANIDLTKSIVKALNKPETEAIEYVADRPGHDFRYAMDISKARQELNWQPEVNFEEGLQLTIDWYRNNKEWWQKLKK